MADDLLKHANALLERLNHDIQKAFTRYQDLVDRINADEKDFWMRDHKMQCARARLTLEKADLEVERQMLIRNMATMNNAKPLAGVVVNTN